MAISVEESGGVSEPQPIPKALTSFAFADPILTVRNGKRQTGSTLSIRAIEALQEPEAVVISSDGAHFYIRAARQDDSFELKRRVDVSGFLRVPHVIPPGHYLLEPAGDWWRLDRQDQELKRTVSRQYRNGKGARERDSGGAAD